LIERWSLEALLSAGCSEALSVHREGFTCIILAVRVVVIAVSVAVKVYDIYVPEETDSELLLRKTRRKFSRQALRMYVFGMFCKDTTI
jgi:hypothetical protein